MKYKLSMFTYLLRDKEDLILYSTLTKKIVSIKPGIDMEEVLCYDYPNMTKLKKYLLDNFFIVPESEDERSKGLLKYYDTVFDRGLTLTLLATEQCNFRCRYCYEEFARGEMSPRVINGLIQYLKRQLHTYSRLHIEWFGGEPLLGMGAIREFSEKAIALARLAKKPYSAGMTTNGYLLTPELLKELIRYRVFAYQITIDGTQEFHDQLRVLPNGTGSFTTIFDNLRRIRDTVRNPILHFTIRSNISSDNFENMDKYIEMMRNEFGEDNRFSCFFRPIGDWGGERVKDLNSTLLNSMSPILDKIRDNCTKGNILDLNLYTELLGSGVCYAGKRNNFVVGANGIVYKCTVNFENEVNKVGHVNEDGSVEIDYQKLSKWVTPSGVPDKCRLCYSSLACPGGQCAAQRVAEREHREVDCGYERNNIDEILRLLNDYSDQVVRYEWKENEYEQR